MPKGREIGSFKIQVSRKQIVPSPCLRDKKLEKKHQFLLLRLSSRLVFGCASASKKYVLTNYTQGPPIFPPLR